MMVMVIVLLGHVGAVWCAEWSPNGKLLATCGGDKCIRIWTHIAASNSWECTDVLEGV